MKNCIKKLIPTLTITAFIFIGTFVFVLPINAQLQLFTPSETPSGALNLSLTPQHPGPDDKVTAKLSSLRHDLERANISWYENGLLIDRGDGLKVFSFVAPSFGRELNIKVSVITKTGITLSTSEVVRPASITLVWEADSSVPPFYKGKALLPPQGHVRIVAIPKISGASSNSIIYTWKKNGTVLGSLSGLGRNVLEVDMSVTDRSLFIVVEAKAQNGIVAQQGLTLSTVQPSAHLYENSATLGTLFNKSTTGTFELINEEVRLESYPYSLSNNSRRGVSYSWNIDGGSVDGANFGEYLVLRKGSGSGKSSVSVEIDDVSKILQRAFASLVITFESDE